MSSNVDICPSCKSVLPFPDEKPLRSLLTPFLGTNRVPSDSERHLGEEFVTQLSAEIANVEDQISRLQRFKNRLRLYRKEHLSVLSKFRMLPVEVIASIFVILVNSLAQRERPSTTPSYPDPVRLNLMNIPFTLASVCQQWRTIATSIPSLWLNINLSTRERDFMRCVAQTTCCLSRSDNRHLNVDMDLRHDARDAFKDAPPQWLKEVRRSSCRWREARMTFGYADTEHLRAVMGSSWNFAELKFLSLAASWENGVSFPTISAPQLAEVEFCNVHIKGFPLRHLQKLRKLSLLEVRLSEALNAVAECDGLSHLRCRVVNNIFSFTPPPRLVHNTLVSLETSEVGSPGDHTPLTSILQRLKLPALQELTLGIQPWENDPWRHTTAHDHVLDFISDSKCMLKTFALERVMVSKAEWARYAPLLSTLTVLKLTENRVCIHNDILESLAVVGNEDEVVLPQLQRLEYNFHARSSRDSDYETIFSLLVGVVKSRWENIGESSVVHRIESIDVRGARPGRRLKTFAPFCALDALRQKGFDLEMHFL